MEKVSDKDLRLIHLMSGSREVYAIWLANHLHFRAINENKSFQVIGEGKILMTVTAQRIDACIPLTNFMPVPNQN